MSSAEEQQREQEERKDSEGRYESSILSEEVVLEAEQRGYVFFRFLGLKSSIAVGGFLGGAAAILFTVLLFPATFSLLGAGLLIPVVVGLLIGLEVAIVLNLLLRDEMARDAGMRRLLIWFAVLLASASMAALALTLALGVAPGLLFVSGPGGWVALGVVSAVIGLLALASVFALANTAGPKTRGTIAWREFKNVLRSFHKGPGLQFSKSLDAVFAQSHGSHASDPRASKLIGSSPAGPQADSKLLLGVEVPKKEASEKPIRIMIVGASGSGKTALAKRYAKGQAPNESDEQTIAMEFYGLETEEGVTVLQIQDTAGSPRFRFLIEDYYQNSSGYEGPEAIMLAYDINDKSSLEALYDFLPGLAEKAPLGTPIMLVACKDDAEPDYEEEKVTPEDVDQFIANAQEKYWNMNLINFETPTSAMTGDGVDAAFEALAEEAIEAMSAGQKATPNNGLP